MSSLTNAEGSVERGRSPASTRAPSEVESEARQAAQPARATTSAGPVTPVPGRSPGLGARTRQARSEGEGQAARTASSPTRTAQEAASEHGSVGATASRERRRNAGEDAASPAPVEPRSRAERSQARSRVSAGIGRLHSARPGPVTVPRPSR